MILADLCVRRPVFATMFIGVLLVLGWFSYMRLGVDLYPKVEVPMVMVETYLPGAAPEETEARVTKPLEEVINTVTGIDELRSTTLEGVSEIMIEFKLDRDINAGVQDVRDKISTILDQLPEGTKPPLVRRFDMDSMPILTFTMTGYQAMKELTEIGDASDQGAAGIGRWRRFDRHRGRARARSSRSSSTRIGLRATGLSVQQVAAALNSQNVEYPGGQMKNGMSEKMLRTLGRITEVPDFSAKLSSASNRASRY